MEAVPIDLSPYLRLLKQYWGYDSFRGIQAQIIASIVSGRDTLGLMPTGGGKSVTFQLPALTMAGVCIVFSPLIALMNDQVARLKQLGIKATTINSTLDQLDQEVAFRNCLYGGYKLLYISPERLDSPVFIEWLRRLKVSFFTVDEAHCISQWGHDFRPAYRRIARLREMFPDVPCLALTATATPQVQQDIMKQLAFREPNVIRMSFRRANLSYMVRFTDNKPRALLGLLRHGGDSSIVYTRSRERTVKLAAWLTQQGFPSFAFHAGMHARDKEIKQSEWQNGNIPTIVATNAFGMGIDKPNVRQVIHYDAPPSIEEYFQEAGRAGRDGLTSQAVILYNSGDTARLRRGFSDSFPSLDVVRQVFIDLCSFYSIPVGEGRDVVHEFNEMRFCSGFHYFPTRLHSALSILNRYGYIGYRSQDDSVSRLMFIVRRDDLYTMPSLPPRMEKLIEVVLRLYPGIFSQYTYIDEEDIAGRLRTTVDAVYEDLKQIARQHIIHYIPRKNIPHIYFTVGHIDSDEIRIPVDDYNRLKLQQERRLKAVIDYVSEEDECRSRWLLRYFGEETKDECGMCDVCRSGHLEGSPQAEDESAALAIVQLLSDGESHSFEQIKALPFRPTVLRRVLRQLRRDGEVESDEGKTWIRLV